MARSPSQLRNSHHKIYLFAHSSLYDQPRTPAKEEKKKRKKEENQLLMMIKQTPTTLKEKEGCKHSLYERVCFKEHCESVGLICRGGWWLYHAVAPTPSRRLQFLFSSSWNENSKCISSRSFHELNYVLGKRILIIFEILWISRFSYYPHWLNSYTSL